MHPPHNKISAEERRKRERARHTNKQRNTARGKINLLRQRARMRARDKGIPFDISARDIATPTVCPVLGIPIGYVPNTPLANRCSLDRVKPALGYVKGNVVAISYRANALKNNATIDELRAILAYMEAHELAS